MQGNKEQLEEVWEESDGLDRDDFDPKTFFHLHGKLRSNTVLSHYDAVVVFARRSDLDCELYFCIVLSYYKELHYKKGALCPHVLSFDHVFNSPMNSVHWSLVKLFYHKVGSVLH